MGSNLVNSSSVDCREVTRLTHSLRLLYRAWQVCQTPNEVLVDKLGLDIPPNPEVTLEEITAREIRLAWKQPDFHNSIHKHIIQVNNVKGKRCPSVRQETSLTFQWANRNERRRWWKF